MSLATRPAYYPQIDALRLIAVCVVFGEHFAPRMLHRLGMVGGYGVWLFFVISGFLITGILLRYREKIEEGGATLSGMLKTFYVRRALRIFPAYYLLLAVLFLAGWMTVSEGLLWHLTYTSNFLVVKVGSWEGMASHLWSLSVEEQFYLLWPLVVLWISRRWLVPTIVSAIVIAVVYRFVAVRWDWGLAYSAFTLSNLDSLGVGALLAVVMADGRQAGLTTISRTGMAALLVLPVFGLFIGSDFYRIAAPCMVAIASGFLVLVCTKGVGGRIGALMSLPPVLYLGRISYGLYLFHIPVRELVPGDLGLGIEEGALRTGIACVVWTIVTVAVAAASWHLFEAPLNRMKATVAPSTDRLAASAAARG